MGHPSAAPPAPTRPARPGRRQRRQAETRERIYRAALHIFARRGYGAATIEQITEAADVGKGTFFNYFPSKEHLLAAFGELQLGKARSVAEQYAGSRPLREVLHLMIHKLAEEPGRSRGLVRSLLSGTLSGDAAGRIVSEHWALGRQRIAGLFAAAQRTGELCCDRTPAELALFLQQCYMGALIFWTMTPGQRLVDILDQMLDLFWAAGIQKAPAQRKREVHP